MEAAEDLPVRAAQRKRQLSAGPAPRPRPLSPAQRRRRLLLWAAWEKRISQALPVSGPEKIQTLRGRLLGREVAIVCASESHEDAINLTRSKSIPEEELGWVSVACNGRGLDLRKAIAKKSRATFIVAKKWAESVITEDSYSADSEDEDVGAWFVFEPLANEPKGKGMAYVLPSKVGLSSKHKLSPGSIVYKWDDLDEQARIFNQRRLSGEGVPSEEHMALIAKRKKVCLEQGFELFDDWLIRQATCQQVRVEVILEAPVAAAEVELHREPRVGSAPPGHDCLRNIELDSDEDSDEDDDPGDGTGSFLEYLYHRLRIALPPEQLHGVDPRELGCDNDPCTYDAFQSLVSETLPQDAEEILLDKLGAGPALQAMELPTSPLLKPAVMRRQRRQWRRARRIQQNRPQPVPSWEAFFGVAAEILYHSPVVKADYTPFLAKCVRSPEALQNFFEKLYFGTLPEALSQVRLDEETRCFARTRSLAYLPPGQKTASLMRRPDDQGLVPIKAAPLDVYLKARGSQPPRTWVSGLVQQLERSGAHEIVKAARAWYLDSAKQLLAHAKGDGSGDYFVAFLRQAHRDIYDDIDVRDPEELTKKTWVSSKSHPNSKKHRHNLQNIRIPNFKQAFSELLGLDSKAGCATRRQRVLSKILVDAFQLRLVDLAAILKVASITASAASDERLVFVLYAGADHTANIVKFWTSHGFSFHGDVVGKDDWDEDESRCLNLPTHLHNFDELFPVQ